MRNGPNHYKSLEEFEREEIRPGEKLGWSLEDLMEEAKFQAEHDYSFEKEPEELDFG